MFLFNKLSYMYFSTILINKLSYMYFSTILITEDLLEVVAVGEVKVQQRLDQPIAVTMSLCIVAVQMVCKGVPRLVNNSLVIIVWREPDELSI